MDRSTSSPPEAGAPEPLIAFQNVTKRFGGLYANRDITFRVFAGAIHAVVGENGAGKSTLMKMLFGHFQPDGGQIRIDGNPVRLSGPRDAMRLGIGMVHQELLVMGQLTVLENIVLGAEPARAGVVAFGAAKEALGNLARDFGFALPLDSPAESLSFAQRQHVALLRILFRKARILILDEPTSMLAPREADRLLDLLKSLRAAGHAILFVSHRLREVFEVADRITVLRRGRLEADVPAAQTSIGEVAELIGGQKTESARRKVEGGDRKTLVPPSDFRPPLSDFRHLPSDTRHPASDMRYPASVLELREICAGPCGNDSGLSGVSFDVMGGEVLGIGGVSGNGQRTLARALAGVCAVTEGNIVLCGRDITQEPVSRRIGLGLRWLPENPAEESLLEDRPIWENLLLGRQRDERMRRGGLLLQKEAVRAAKEQIETHGVAAGSPLDAVSALSGGNRQKIALARALWGKPVLGVLENPARGLDIRAAGRTFRQISGLAAGGTSFVFISSDLEELLFLCSRIAILYRGRIVGVAPGGKASREVLGRWMLGMG